MYPYPLFLNVNLYGIMIAFGLVCAFVFLWWLCAKKKINKKFSDFLTIDAVVSIVVGFLFAAFFQALYNYIEDPSAGFSFNGGITFLGGIAGGAVCFLVIYFIFRKRFKQTLYDVLTIFPISITIAHAFGRLGCFFAGCCYGVETDAWYGIKFVTTATKVVPTNLFEAIFLFILFGIMLTLFLRKKFDYNLPLYCVCYGVWRFVIEFWRGDHRGEFLFGLTPSQFWSILLVVVGVALFFVLHHIKNKKKAVLKQRRNAKT